MTARIFRYVVPVDGQVHRVEFHAWREFGAQVGQMAASARSVEFWAEHNDEAPVAFRDFLVVGTGHPVPVDPVRPAWVGTAPRTPEGLVWHLFEVLRLDGLADR